MPIKFSSVFSEVKAYFIITCGLLCYVLGWDVFLIPNNMVGGGVTGISAVLYYAFGINVSISFFVINTILLLIALKVLGKAFGVKTVYAIIITSVFLEFVPKFISPSFIEEFAMSNGNFLCGIFGGVMSGLGIGICFSQGGSTGGTDIIALMVNKYRNISPGRMILTMDIFIIASSLLIPAKEVLDPATGQMVLENWGQRLATVLYGYILIASCGYTVDLFLAGTKQSSQVFIFSKKYPQLADRIVSDLHRGVTLLDGTGWYTKEPHKVILVITRKTEMSLLYKLIKEVDKDAFISVGSVMGVYGKGFDEIKK